MTEYVTKEQVKEELLSWARCINNPELLVTEDALYVIDALPAADVRPVVHGRWIEYDDDYGAYCCSVCEQDAPEDTKWPYCPNCMADMRGGDSE